jgi:hypothetical protein
MKKILLLLLLTPVLAMAQSSPFDGTWKVDLKKAQLPKKPDIYLLQNGMYSCKSCVPAYEIKADGTDQPVSGHPYASTIAVKVIDDHTIQTMGKKDGKEMFSGKWVVSSDGDMMTIDWKYSGNPEGGPVTGKDVEKRVGPKPAAGANMVSGSWREEKTEDVPASALTTTFKTSGDELSMSTPTGQSYTAKLGGGEAPYKGDPGITSVSLKKINDHTIEETDMREGKVISIARMTVSTDGKKMTIDVTDKLHGTTSRYVADKQS